MDSRPKVLFIMHMPPPVHGAAMMGKYIHDSELINSEFNCQYINETLSSAVSEVGKFKFGKLTTLWNHVKNISNTLASFKPDLVYITPGGADPEPGLIRYVFEFLTLNRSDCKLLIHFHNKGTKEKSSKWYARWYYRLLFKKAHVILLSKYLIPQYELYLSSDQITICPNGIPIVSNDYCYQRDNELPKILFLSNLIVNKGVLVLLDALRILKDRRFLFECNFVGGPTNELNSDSFQNEINAREIQDCVSYLGPKYGADKEKVLAEADIFTFPTFYEGECFPLVLLEAMQHSLPCVSTPEGGIRDIILDGENGFLCNQKDSLALADALQTLIEDKSLREKMGRKGKEIFDSRFTKRHFEENICNILRKQIL